MSDKHGTTRGLTIQERIRAMNETLDTVERMPTHDSDGLTDDADGPSSPPVASPATHKRTSVVDIWRKRESNATLTNVPVERMAATKKITRTNPSILKPNHTGGTTSFQATLDDVKTELSLKFLGVAGPSVSSTGPSGSLSEAEEKKDGEKEDDIEICSTHSVPVSKSPKWNGAMRGVASASPTPPPLPNSNRKSFGTKSNSPSSSALPTASAPQPPLAVKQINRIPVAPTNSYLNEEPADLTILPAMSSASSSIGSDVVHSSNNRSSKVASIWQKLSTSSGGTSAASSVTLPPSRLQNDVHVPAPPPPPADATVTHTPPTLKRSVVDIWQKRVSPASSAVVVPVPRAVEPAVPVEIPPVTSPTADPVTNRHTLPKQPSWTHSSPRVSPPRDGPLTPSPPSVKSARSSNGRQWLETNPTFDSTRLHRVESGGSKRDSIPGATSFHRAEAEESVDCVDRLLDNPSERLTESYELDSETKASDTARRWGQRSPQGSGELESPVPEVVAPSNASTLSSPDRPGGGRVADRWKARMDALAAEKAQQSATVREVAGPAKYGSQRSNSVSSNLAMIPSPTALPKKIASEPGKPKGRISNQWNDGQLPIKAPPLYSQHEGGDHEGCRPSFSLSPAPSEGSRKSARSAASSVKEVETFANVPSATVTPSQPEARRGKVTDRYPLSGSPSFQVSISPIMKDYVAHTPAGLSRNKVAGRWIESKSVRAEKTAAGDKGPPKPISVTGLGSGANIIDAWVDSKADEQRPKELESTFHGRNEGGEGKQGSPAFTGTVDGGMIQRSTPPFLDKLSSPENPGGQRSIEKRWSTQKSPTTPTGFDTETVADLLKIASRETPTEPPRDAINDLEEPVTGVSAIRERWIKREIGSAQISPGLGSAKWTASAVKSRKEIAPKALDLRSVEPDYSVVDSGDKNVTSAVSSGQSVQLRDEVANQVHNVPTSPQDDPAYAQSPPQSSRSSTNVADRWKKRVARAGEGSIVGDSANAQSPVIEVTTVPVVQEDMNGELSKEEQNASSAAEANTSIQVEGEPERGSEGDQTNIPDHAMIAAVPESCIECTSDGNAEPDICPDANPMMYVGDENLEEKLLPATSTHEMDTTENSLISKYSRDSVASLRREIDESDAIDDTAEMIGTDSVSLTGEGQVGQTSMDEFLHDSIAFIPLSGIKMPLPDTGRPSPQHLSIEGNARLKQDPPVEPRNDPPMGSPLRIINAWSEKFSAMSVSMNHSQVSTSRSASAQSIPNIEDPKLSHDLGTKNGSSERVSFQDPISPHQIIDAWSQKSSINSSDTPEPADLAKPANQEKISSAGSTASVSDSNQGEVIVRSANSSAFAPWNNSAENRSDSVLQVKEDTPIKSKKNFMMLGRKHLVSRIPKKPEDTTESVEQAMASNDPEENAIKLPGTKNQYSAGKRAFPPMSLSNEETTMIEALRKSTASNGSTPGYHLSTPVASNRRSIDSVQGRTENPSSIQSSQSSKETLVATTSSSSTRKLASDKLSNRKRLQSYRRKAIKASVVEPDSVAPIAGDANHPTDRLTRALTDDQESEVTGPTPQIAPFDSDSIQRANSDTAPLSSNSLDDKSLLRSVRSESGNSHHSDYDASAFDDICRTSSTATSSALANKAEKMLQQRRRRTDPDDLRVVTEDSHNSGFSVPPTTSQRTGETGPHSYHTDREEILLNNGRPRLSTRYNTSSRFMDADGSTASMSAPGMTTDGSESMGSSCVQSTETATSGSDSRFFAARRHATEAETHKRRQPTSVKTPSEPMEEKSVNTSGHSAWDSDWVSDVGFDLNKLAMAVDERVTALRDFVGGQASKPSKSNLATQRNDLMDVEDVAIEVEYVEDSDNDGDYDEDDFDDLNLGMCAAPLGDDMKRSFHCSDTKAAIKRCSEMLPAGQPSFEQKPTSRNTHNGFV